MPQIEIYRIATASTSSVRRNGYAVSDVWPHGCVVQANPFFTAKSEINTKKTNMFRKHKRLSHLRLAISLTCDWPRGIVLQLQRGKLPKTVRLLGKGSKQACNDHKRFGAPLGNATDSKGTEVAKAATSTQSCLYCSRHGRVHLGDNQIRLNKG